MKHLDRPERHVPAPHTPSRRRRGQPILALAAVGLSAGVFALAQTAAPAAGWSMGGRDLHNTRHQPNETALTPATVGKLVPAWTFTTAGDVSATPAVEGNAVYLPDWGGNLYRINALTGKAEWTRTISSYSNQPHLAARTTPAIAGDLLILGDQPDTLAGKHAGTHLLALEKASGALRWKLDIPDGPAIITQSPVVYGGRIYVGLSSNEESLSTDPTYPCCSFRGRMLAVSLASGKILWQTYTVPQGYSGGTLWGSTPVIDTVRGSVYVATGNNYTLPKAVAACINAGRSGCESADNHIDSVLALDLNTGKLKWARRFEGPDAWVSACYSNGAGIGACPTPQGPDFDFGSGPNLFTVGSGGAKRDLLGAGQKSGVYWALNPADGQVVWSTRVGPGGVTGGILWGSATDGQRVYVANANSNHQTWTLPGGKTTSAGTWSALDAASGRILWQTPDPEGGLTPGAVTSAGGVVYGGSLDPQGHMYALNAASGKVLWRFASGGSVNAGAAVAAGRVYWGSGYTRLNQPGATSATGSKRFYAFRLP